MTTHEMAFDSTNLQNAIYDTLTHSLTINFNNGGSYRYDNVPEDVWSGLASADSAGSFFHQQIRNVFDYTRLQ